ncbi:MAG: RDD family protein [Phycisphaerae bacterium]|jgi:uncharacterized RDD family membrane protein YckC|nr:RDD family protein [Phycisphaerae bacterium]
MGARRFDKLVIRTPEGFTFSMLLAGPIIRFMAWVIDTLIVVGIIIMVFIATIGFSLISGDFAGMFFFVMCFVVWFGYGIVLEWYCHGKTVGKRIFNLRVVDEHGLQLTFAQIAVRNLLRAVDCLPLFYVVGGSVSVLSRRSQRLGDIAAGTVVVRTVEASLPNLAGVVGGDKYNSFTHYPHIEARLRQRVSPAEARIALQALLRRDSLDPDRRIELFAELGEHFKEMLDFPAEATDGLSNEQYIRNIVDTLFRSQLGTQP